MMGASSATLPRTNAHRLAAAASLLDPVTETPRLDAEILLAHVLGLSRSQLLAHLHDRPEAAGFDALLLRRLAHEPIAYILGEWEFYSLAFEVVAPLLVPRPETEHLVEAVLAFIGSRPTRAMEIGVGTGCVSVSVARNAPNCRIIAGDIQPVALDTAARNAARHNVQDRIVLRKGSLFEVLTPNDTPLDAIFSNPPYVEDAAWDDLPEVIRRHEDPKALLAGKDGLDIVRLIAAEAPHWLRPGGLLAMEIGMGQHEAVQALLEAHGYADIIFHRDLACIPRIACANMP